MNANEIFWLIGLTTNSLVVGLNVGMWAANGTRMKWPTQMWTFFSAVMVVACFIRLAVH